MLDTDTASPAENDQPQVAEELDDEAVAQAEAESLFQIEGLPEDWQEQLDIALQ